MMRGLYLSLLVACAQLVSPLSYAQSTAGEMDKRIEAYLSPFVETDNFSGVVCVTRNNRIVFQKGYGKANYEFGISNTPDTRFHIASVSKSFTAVAILLLEERGRLKTSDPVSKFIPDYPNGDKIQLQHL